MTPRLRLCIAGLTAIASLAVGASAPGAYTRSSQERVYIAQSHDIQSTVRRDDRMNYRQRVRVQRLLHALGFRPGPIDGKIGPRTRRAVRAYRSEKGLRPHGWVTDRLMVMLEADYTRIARNRPATTRRTVVRRERTRRLDRMDALRSTAPVTPRREVIRTRRTTTTTATTRTRRQRNDTPPTNTTPSFTRRTETPEADSPSSPGGWN